MKEDQKNLTTTMSEIYINNQHVNLLKMKLLSAAVGEVIMEMPIIYELHTNLHNKIHGGALMSLMDTAMGLTCGTHGKKVVTTEASISYLRTAEVGDVIEVKTSTLKAGSRLIVLESEAYHQTSKELIAKARASFFIIGNFEF